MILPQRSPGCGALLLAEVRQSNLHVGCDGYGRSGRYGVASLVERFGPCAVLPDVLASISADCPRRGAGRFSDPCGAVWRGVVQG